MASKNPFAFKAKQKEKNYIRICIISAVYDADSDKMMQIKWLLFRNGYGGPLGDRVKTESVPE